MRRVFVAVVLFLIAVVPCRADPFAYTWEKVADGVWAGIRADPFELPQEGNTVVVVTTAGAVVFDAGGSPAMGEAIVAKVRELTDRGVTDVVISHWHGDHMRGLQPIVGAWPSANIIAHADARDWIARTTDKWIKRRVGMVPNIRRVIEDALAHGKDLSGRALTQAEGDWLRAGQRILDRLDAENRRTDYVVPGMTTSDNLTLFRGGREIRILHPGKAHTSSDLVMWLPDARLVATGDIVTAPVPLMPSAYTRTYQDVLHRIVALDFAVLVPGHGAVERDAKYLGLLDDTIGVVVAQVHALVAKGLDKDKAVAGVDFSQFEPRFTHGDPFLAHRFEDYVKTALPAAAYQVEISGEPGETF
jgi:cyclase